MLVYKRQLLRPKTLEKGSKSGSGSGLVVIMGCVIRSKKTLMKTRFISKVIMFEECLYFKYAIILCYGKQKVVALQQKVLKG
jgi:hypothetical protein